MTGNLVCSGWPIKGGLESLHVPTEGYHPRPITFEAGSTDEQDSVGKNEALIELGYNQGLVKCVCVCVRLVVKLPMAASCTVGITLTVVIGSFIYYITMSAF